MAMALARSCGGKTLVRIDSVDGMTKAAPRPITARPRMTPSAVSRKAATRQPARKTSEPDLQRALAAVPVAEGAGGEQEPGEHQGVGVDHPLELRAGGVELAGQRGQRDVEAGVARR